MDQGLHIDRKVMHLYNYMHKTLFKFRIFFLMWSLIYIGLPLDSWQNKWRSNELIVLLLVLSINDLSQHTLLFTIWMQRLLRRYIVFVLLVSLPLPPTSSSQFAFSFFFFVFILSSLNISCYQCCFVFFFVSPSLLIPYLIIISFFLL